MSERPDVFRPGSAALSVLAQIVGNGLALLQHIAILQCADVDEDVISPSIWRDEAKAFVCVEKLNLARRHGTPHFTINGMNTLAVWFRSIKLTCYSASRLACGVKTDCFRRASLER